MHWAAAGAGTMVLAGARDADTGYRPPGFFWRIHVEGQGPTLL